MIILVNGPPNTLVENICPFCGKCRTKLFRTKEFDAWQSGELIQNAMPNASPDDREFLITGMCNDCFPKEE